jgi:hypothetical protein
VNDLFSDDEFKEIRLSLNVKINRILNKLKRKENDLRQLFMVADQMENTNTDEQDDAASHAEEKGASQDMESLRRLRKEKKKTRKRSKSRNSKRRKRLGKGLKNNALAFLEKNAIDDKSSEEEEHLHNCCKCNKAISSEEQSYMLSQVQTTNVI